VFQNKNICFIPNISIYIKTSIVFNAEILFLVFKDDLQNKCVHSCWVCAIGGDKSDCKRRFQVEGYVFGFLPTT